MRGGEALFQCALPLIRHFTLLSPLFSYFNIGSRSRTGSFRLLALDSIVDLVLGAGQKELFPLTRVATSAGPSFVADSRGVLEVAFVLLLPVQG